MSCNFDDLTCSSCSNVLSIPPIFTSQDGQENRCGRCKPLGNMHRNILFETLAKHMMFRCIYKECTQKLQWGDIAVHESVCPNRLIECPFYDCKMSYYINETETHFDSKHSVLLQKGHNVALTGVCNNQKELNSSTHFVKINNHCYVAYIVTDDVYFYFNVYSLVLEAPQSTFTCNIHGKTAIIDFSSDRKINILPTKENLLTDICSDGSCIKLKKLSLIHVLDIAQDFKLKVFLDISIPNDTSIFTKQKCEDIISTAIICDFCSKLLQDDCYITYKGYSCCENCKGQNKILGRNYIIESLIQKFKMHHPNFEAKK